MSPATSLRKLVAVAGMLLLAPICLQILTGQVTPADAGVRAAWLFAGVVVIRRLVALVPGPRVVAPVDDEG